MAVDAFQQQIETKIRQASYLKFAQEVARTLDLKWRNELSEMIEVYAELAAVYTLHDFFARFAWDLNDKLLTPLTERVLQLNLVDAAQHLFSV